uniref:Uncharacterized protein n=1 Tax=Ditylenchus dipsaci TaxID=166011 RepID=A0A915DYK0_9BILA
MEREREEPVLIQDTGLTSEVPAPLYDQHLFKKLLVACCDSCERRASLIVPSPSSEDEGSPTCEEDEEEHIVRKKKGHNSGDEGDDEEDEEDEDDENAFECPEENKTEMHDTLANMYFNKVVLPEMEYVEDFADFLIDAELNELPVLKRACERYLCGELNSKQDLLTSLLLELLFLSMVFQLPVMKSMTLTELCNRYSELENVDKLLKQEEYIHLDKRIRQMCDRNLAELVDECKRFREQRLRVHAVQLN